MNEFEQRWHDLGEFIREQRSIGHLSLRKLSEMAGISNPYLSQIERGLRKPSAEILRQIASALQISAETLYVRAGILDEPGSPTDLVAEIRRAPDLDEEQKRALVQIYETFRRERAGREAGEASDGPDAAAPTAEAEAQARVVAEAAAATGEGNGKASKGRAPSRASTGGGPGTPEKATEPARSTKTARGRGATGGTSEADEESAGAARR